MKKAALYGLILAACGRAAGPSPSTPPAPDLPPYTAADVQFMSGMIMHHEQAVLIAGWSAEPARGASASIRTLSERIVVAQQDEIALARRWLAERSETGHPMAGHVMPGMLTPAQLSELKAAQGTQYDRTFLTLMIQHHEGALQMVAELLGRQGAAQDGRVFRFAADVHAEQTTEIDRMRRMLAALTPGGTSP